MITAPPSAIITTRSPATLLRIVTTTTPPRTHQRRHGMRYHTLPIYHDDRQRPTRNCTPHSESATPSARIWTLDKLSFPYQGRHFLHLQHHTTRRSHTPRLAEYRCPFSVVGPFSHGVFWSHIRKCTRFESGHIFAQCSRDFGVNITRFIRQRS